MNVQKQILQYMQCNGITISHVAKKTNIDYELLRLSLKANRRMTADEFVGICKCLSLEIKHFD